MYKIKQKPEDFVVKEISNIEIKPSGKYLIYKLTKKNYNTLDAIAKVAKSLGIKEKQIGFAGNKDRIAVTEQIISLIGVSKERSDNVIKDDLKLEFLGYSDQPVALGDLTGNTFEIIVRDVDNKKVKSISFITNYFDEQRFSKNNVQIGKHIVKKEFSEAVKLIDEKKVIDYLKNKPNDFVGALRILPIRLLRIYVNALQSFLWNESVKEHLEKKILIVKRVQYSEGELVFTDQCDDNLFMPLIGFGMDKIENEEIKIIIDHLLKKESLNCEDFIIKQIPEISAEGGMRKVFVEVKDFSLERLSEGEIRTKFTLPKGSYATIVIKRIY